MRACSHAFSQDDENLLYIVKSAAEGFKNSKWAEVEEIYNTFVERKRSVDSLKYKHKRMDSALLEARTKTMILKKAEVERKFLEMHKVSRME